MSLCPLAMTSGSDAGPLLREEGAESLVDVGAVVGVAGGVLGGTVPVFTAVSGFGVVLCLVSGVGDVVVLGVFVVGCAPVVLVSGDGVDVGCAPGRVLGGGAGCVEGVGEPVLFGPLFCGPLPGGVLASDVTTGAGFGLRVPRSGVGPGILESETGRGFGVVPRWSGPLFVGCFVPGVFVPGGFVPPRLPKDCGAAFVPGF
ncbi:hypothetical protein [Umezawaea beigongshangensis]|uniref:hypothetical protein n=1 Tax=Umezawaea beigongshangensis TaxID=2780383 RepID=UPI0018F1521D|nr:hypothetical protein [Umezawaea beigongshangensis]